MKSTSWFTSFAQAVAKSTGDQLALVGAVFVLVVWSVNGLFLEFSDIWQLVINTGTTVITFLMVLIVQNTQNRDTLAIRMKVDEVILALVGANNEASGDSQISNRLLGSTVPTGAGGVS